MAHLSHAEMFLRVIFKDIQFKDDYFNMGTQRQTMKKINLLKSFTAACALCIIAMSPAAVQAAPIVDPGLGTGNQYRLMFRTSVTMDATSSNIADYNAFVTGVANANATLASLGSTWMVVGSTTTVDARDNTNTNPFTETGVPIYLLDGTTKIADNNADLWDGTIDAFVNRNENGDLFTGGSVFTGTQGNGTAFPTGELGSGAFTFAGLPNATNSGWVSASAPANTTQLTFFAISGLIEDGVAQNSAVPEPGTLAIFGLSLVGLGIARRRARQA
jgi:hypothetical protein